jgi:hypothetical protein
MTSGEFVCDYADLWHPVVAPNNFNTTQTLALLHKAYCEATAGRIQGLQNIYSNSTGKYDFGWTPQYRYATWNLYGTTMDANQMGNFIAGFEAGAYDTKYSETTGGGNATAAVFAYGLYYHLSGKTHAHNDPLDFTGDPDIANGVGAGMTYTDTACQ